MLKKLVLILCLLIVSGIALAQEGPVDVVRRTYGWIYRPLPLKEYRLSDSRVIRRALLAADDRKLSASFDQHKLDFAPTLRSLLCAIEQTEAENRNGTRQWICWDNYPLTWSDCSELVDPPTIIEKRRSKTTSIVTVSTTAYSCSKRYNPTTVLVWDVDLIQLGNHWQISDLRFEGPGHSVVKALNGIKDLREIAKNYR